MAYAGSGLGALPFRFGPQAVSAPASVRRGPSNEDVLRSLYGSVEKGRAVQAASIAEAQQRSAELHASSRIPQTTYTPPPAILSPNDYTPAPQQSEVLVPDEDVESDGDVIEEVAEGEEEGDAAFSGWGIGMGERPVGVTFTRREVARMGDVRRHNQRREKMRKLMRLRGKLKPGAPFRRILRPHP